jgi:hypothetical protein
MLLWSRELYGEVADFDPDTGALCSMVVHG